MFHLRLRFINEKRKMKNHKFKTLNRDVYNSLDTTTWKLSVFTERNICKNKLDFAKENMVKSGFSHIIYKANRKALWT